MTRELTLEEKNRRDMILQDVLYFLEEYSAIHFSVLTCLEDIAEGIADTLFEEGYYKQINEV